MRLTPNLLLNKDYLYQERIIPLFTELTVFNYT